MMIKRILILLLVTLVTVGCKSSKDKNEKKYLNYLLNTDDYIEVNKINEVLSETDVDSILSSTTDFYDIKIVSKPTKKVFNIKERKIFSLGITNYGDKSLYVPEWFKRYNLNNSELFIEIYSKKGTKLKEYVQKRIKTQTFIQPKLKRDREIFSSNNGKNLLYKNLEIDIFNKIVDEGNYLAKVYIDLSNFGYFKIIETEFSFDVKND